MLTSTCIVEIMIQWIAQCIVAVLLLGSLNRLSSVICTVSAIDPGQGKIFSYNLPGMDAALIYLCECFDLCASLRVRVTA